MIQKKISWFLADGVNKKLTVEVVMHTHVDSTLARFQEDIPLGKISHYRRLQETVILSFLPFNSLRKSSAAIKRLCNCK